MTNDNNSDYKAPKWNFSLYVFNTVLMTQIRSFCFFLAIIKQFKRTILRKSLNLKLKFCTLGKSTFYSLYIFHFMENSVIQATFFGFYGNLYV